jgi:protein-disulfide isomerase-like protein with CxxC motif
VLHPFVTTFAVTWDYRCPFARNAHEHLLRALATDPGWEVTFVPFSLAQVHREEDQADVWDEPGSDSGLLALQVGVAVRDNHPEAFREVHRELFALRHDHGRHLTDESAVAEVLSAAGLDADAVFREVAGGGPLAKVREDHRAAARDHKVWGVPTFVANDSAAFVRLMDRPTDDASSRRTIERVIDLLIGMPELNEFKHTSLSR